MQVQHCCTDTACPTVNTKGITSVIYVLLHIKLSHSKNKYDPGKHVVDQQVRNSESGTKQQAEGVNEEMWEEREVSNKIEEPEK